MKIGLFILSLLLWTSSQMADVNRTKDNDLSELLSNADENRILSRETKMTLMDDAFVDYSTSLGKRERGDSPLEQKQSQYNHKQGRRNKDSAQGPSQLNVTRSRTAILKSKDRENGGSRNGPTSIELTRNEDSKELKTIGRNRRGRARHRQRNDISLWIDENQVRMFSGYNMEIYAIVDGRVMPYILDPDFEDQLPVIPSEVEHVNFTWKSARKRYHYNFDLLTSFDQTILDHPFVSIRKRGRVPRKPKVFSVRIPCAGNVSGVATFGIGLRIQNNKGTPLPDTPLRLRLRKQCELAAGPDPECDKKCANGGVCDEERRCRCSMGYMGQFCHTALCYPQCRNGGTCSSPGRCSCPPGYHGRICEGGICRNKCLNGGKCVQKDTCSCQKGYYGNRCEFST